MAATIRTLLLLSALATACGGAERPPSSVRDASAATDAGPDAGSAPDSGVTAQQCADDESACHIAVEESCHAAQEECTAAGTPLVECQSAKSACKNNGGETCNRARCEGACEPTCGQVECEAVCELYLLELRDRCVTACGDDFPCRMGCAEQARQTQWRCESDVACDVMAELRDNLAD